MLVRGACTLTPRPRPPPPPLPPPPCNHPVTSSNTITLLSLRPIRTANNPISAITTTPLLTPSSSPPPQP
ncbi:hypothetical protein E2C01_073288 [Portunus trituberculatus]|uniref:Uncharacterized protein n=1 Tax=Portunus trituberculatus TaxID=210409 RepID=A0A5B7I0C2_PORTR|nr:hypothetical protein [Portunus trituberculatus]